MHEITKSVRLLVKGTSKITAQELRNANITMIRSSINDDYHLLTLLTSIERNLSALLSPKSVISEKNDINDDYDLEIPKNSFSKRITFFEKQRKYSTQVDHSLSSKPLVSFKKQLESVSSPSPSLSSSSLPPKQPQRKYDDDNINPVVPRDDIDIDASHH